jgi:tetratricopeptide (TPR) repeat protein
LQARLARDPDDDAAYSKLESLYQQGQRWQPLGALYERVLGKNPGNADVSKLEALYQKTQQWQPLGALYERQLAELRTTPRSSTRSRISTVAANSGGPWPILLERRAAKKDPADARAARLERASIFIDKLKDIEAALAVARAFLATDAAAAEEIFAKCVERDPSNPAALMALADLARNRGDYLRAAKFLLDTAERVQNPLELGRLFAEAGHRSPRQLGRRSQGHRALRTRAGRGSRADHRRAAPARLARKARGLGRGRALARSSGAQDRRRRQGAQVGSLPAPGPRRPQAGQARQGRGGARRRDQAGQRIAGAGPRAGRPALRTPSLGRGARRIRARPHPAGRRGTATERAALWEKLAVCSIQTDDLDEALRCYEEALALEPEKRSTLETVIELRTREKTGKSCWPSSNGCCRW